MPEPQQRKLRNRGLKTSLVEESVGEKFKGWRGTIKNKRLRVKRVRHNALRRFGQKSRMARKRSSFKAWRVV